MADRRTRKHPIEQIRSASVSDASAGDRLEAQSLPHESFFKSSLLPPPRHHSGGRGHKKKQLNRAPELLDDDEGNVNLTHTAKRQLWRQTRHESIASPALSLDLTDHPLDLTASVGEPAVAEAGELTCLVARTALVLPFKWSNPMDADLSEWVEHSLSRTIVGPDGERLPLWQVNDKLPYEVTDLDPHFRELIGAKHFYNDDDDDNFETISRNYERLRAEARAAAARAPVEDDVAADFEDIEAAGDADSSAIGGEEEEDDPLDDYCQRLELNPAVLDALFGKARILATNHEGNATTVVCPVRWESVHMVVFPLGTAILMVHVNWLVDENTSMTLAEFRSWLFLSKYQYKSQMQQGWLFRGDGKEIDKYPEAHLASLGVKLAGAIYGNSSVSLSAVGNWLLSGEDEDPDAPPNRVGRYLKRCYHHTCVVVDKKPKQEDIEELLFHLRRGLGQENRPTVSNEHEIDTTLVPRTNRYIGISRQGIACLSWPNSNADLEYEVEKWHTKFLGIFLILSMHVYGEKSVLLELSNLTADSAKLLKGITQTSLAHMASFRLALISLASLMTRYSLQMSSDDCGGLPEYFEFFAALRNVFNIRQQREELRYEIQDVLALIETNYNEEQRKVRNLEKQERMFAEKHRRKQAKLSEHSKTRYERFVTVVSSFTIPIVVVSGIMGMNLDDLPKYWPFWPLMGVTTGVSLVLMVVLICIFRRRAGPQDKVKSPPIHRQNTPANDSAPATPEFKHRSQLGPQSELTPLKLGSKPILPSWKGNLNSGSGDFHSLRNDSGLYKPLLGRERKGSEPYPVGGAKNMPPV